MKITFKDKDLEKCATNAKYGLKKLGQNGLLYFLNGLVICNSLKILTILETMPASFTNLLALAKVSGLAT